MSLYWNDGTSLYHYGIPGQRWGQRRFQNLDGSLTEEGRRRYGIVGVAGAIAGGAIVNSLRNRSKSPVVRQAKAKRQQVANKVKTGAKIAAVGIAAVGAYAIYKDLKNTKEFNDKINVGKGLIERELMKARTAVNNGDIISGGNSRTINYTGNDNKMHQARINYNTDALGRVTGYSYYNMNQGTQSRAKSKTEKAARKAVSTAADISKKVGAKYAPKVKQKAALDIAKTAIKSGLITPESVNLMLEELNKRK